jgi:hypothetical protein
MLRVLATLQKIILSAHVGCVAIQENIFVN